MPSKILQTIFRRVQVSRSEGIVLDAILSKDPAEELSAAKKQQVEKLKNWLSENMRTIKLPDLLIGYPLKAGHCYTTMVSVLQSRGRQ